ncbi:MAG: Rne/Rng family ribonuclease, partial [Deltaproteobacteria bacterium]|nr:Rne/Rng family ribonuclease [Deltaproteobacteria bacterium]
MSKKMLINATLDEENRVAIVDDGILCELDIEVAGHEQTKGNIYKAVVVRVEPGLQAAFIDYGAERLGFLQIDEINFRKVKPDLAKTEKNRGRPKISDLLSRGQELLVQIIREERGTKGAALTTYLSLAGRYMVLMPDNSTRGVSRRAENDTQRKQLKQVMTALELPETFGYIVRTAALDQTKEELERDYRYLMRLYENIYEIQNKAKAPALIYRESNLVIRSIRDYFSAEMDEVLIDDPDMFREAKEFFSVVMPDSVGLVKLHQERRPIFSRFQIEDQIETINSNKVALPSGGSIVIDSTEALVAIDVNSGKMASEQGVEETATKTNLEAAVEIGRQLRLRDLGGLIVIDFIDMRDRKNIQLVEKQLKSSTGLDKARINIGRISQFGLLEMSRQRIKAALSESGYLSCPHCHGSGRIKSPETLAAKLLRRIHTSVAKGQIRRVNAELPLDVASYLLNNKREDLLELERRYNVAIHIHGNPSLLTDQVEIDFLRRDKDKDAKQAFAATDILRSLAEEKAHEEQTNGPIEAVDDTPDEEPPPPKKRRRRTQHKTNEAQRTTDTSISDVSASKQSQQTETSVQPDKAGDSTRSEKDLTLNKPEARHPHQAVSKNVATETQRSELNGID